MLGAPPIDGLGHLDLGWLTRHGLADPRVEGFLAAHAPSSMRLLVAPAGERVHAGVAAGGLVHLHSVPRGAGRAIVERPAPAPDGELRPRPAERRRAVERRAERPALAEGRVDLVHNLPAQEIPAAAALVEDGRVIEERLDQEELLPDEPAEAFHGLQHALEESQSRADLS